MKPIADIIAATYTGLFVDEYQDCTDSQHKLIVALSEILPTRLLGDPLQGIFGFHSEALVDFNSSIGMVEFNNEKHLLEEPWRWKHTNVNLGKDLKEIRKKLEERKVVQLKEYKSIEVIIVNEKELLVPKKNYNKAVWKLLSERSLLIIHPDSSNIYVRKKIIAHFQNRLTLLESIDDKDFYKIAKSFDAATTANVQKIIRDVAFELYDPSTLNIRLNDTGFKRKTKSEEQLVIEPVINSVKIAETNFSFKTVTVILRQIRNIPGIKCYRKELSYAINKALEQAYYNKTTVYDAMITHRNTTLLTKGLEFETVVVLNAHKFTCPKNLYVALTRASKRLIVFTNNFELSPY